MNKQLKLDDEARAMVRALGAKLTALADEQAVSVWHGKFELTVLDADRVWFSYHPTYYYLDDPTMGNESTLKEIYERGVKASESTLSESEQLSAASR